MIKEIKIKDIESIINKNVIIAHFASKDSVNNEVVFIPFLHVPNKVPLALCDTNSPNNFTGVYTINKDSNIMIGILFIKSKEKDKATKISYKRSIKQLRELYDYKSDRSTKLIIYNDHKFTKEVNDDFIKQVVLQHFSDVDVYYCEH